MRSIGIVAKFNLKDAKSKVLNDGDLAAGDTIRRLVLNSTLRSFGRITNPLEV